MVGLPAEEEGDQPDEEGPASIDGGAAGPGETLGDREAAEVEEADGADGDANGQGQVGVSQHLST